MALYISYFHRLSTFITHRHGPSPLLQDSTSGPNICSLWMWCCVWWYVTTLPLPIWLTVETQEHDTFLCILSHWLNHSRHVERKFFSLPRKNEESLLVIYKWMSRKFERLQTRNIKFHLTFQSHSQNQATSMLPKKTSWDASMSVIGILHWSRK